MKRHIGYFENNMIFPSSQSCTLKELEIALYSISTASTVVKITLNFFLGNAEKKKIYAPENMAQS